MAHFHKWQRQNDRATWLTRVFHTHTYTYKYTGKVNAPLWVCVCGTRACWLHSLSAFDFVLVVCCCRHPHEWSISLSVSFSYSASMWQESVMKRGVECEREREVEEEYKNNILVYLQLKLFKLRWNGNVNCCLLYSSCCCSHCCCLSWFNCSRINRTLLKSIRSTSTFLQFLTYTYRMLLLLSIATLKTMLSINVFKYKNKFK